MKKLNLPALTFPALLALALLMIASCARSPYSFVKVQPKRPFESPTPVNTFKTDKQAIRTVTLPGADTPSARFNPSRSEEHTSELQSLMRISYAAFCLKKKTKTKPPTSSQPQ